MKIFLAGATGLLGVRLVPLLVDAGHEVTGMTRTAGKADALAALGATPVVCDVFDRDRLVDAVAATGPDLVMHQLTDLPDDQDALPDAIARNARIRTEGTDNLLAAARGAGAQHVIAQSIAWRPANATSVEHLEHAVLHVGGVVLRYGQFHGPGTWYPTADAVPDGPKVGLERAATLTVEHLDAPSGTYTLVD
jgi:putative NADH-flavin reductase